LKFSVQPPADIFELFIDGESVQSLVNIQEFTEIPMGLSPGPHVINFSYRYNPLNIPILPPSPEERLGAVWIDSVSIETLTVAPPGDTVTTTPGSVSSNNVPLAQLELIRFSSTYLLIKSNSYFLFSRPLLRVITQQEHPLH
jgi:hypothetical protein